MSQAVFEGQAEFFQRSASPLGINRKFSTTSPSTQKRKTGLLGHFSPDFFPAHFKAQKTLEKKRKYEKRLDFRNWLAMRQRQELIKSGQYDDFKTLCGCGRYPVPMFSKTKDGTMTHTGSPGKVTVSWYDTDDPSSALACTWIRKCANPLLCFECAPKVRYFRSEQIQKICRHMLRSGYYWQFWTVTAPHDLSTDPGAQVKLFNEAWANFTKDRRWELFKARSGLEFYILAVEFTDDAPDSDKKSGCHFHYHLIVFFKRSPVEGLVFENEEDENPVFSEEELADMRQFLSRRWSRCLLNSGLISENKVEDVMTYGFRLDVPRMPKNRNKTERIEVQLDQAVEYLVKDASIEMTPGIFTKKGRLTGRLSHWEVMALAFSTRPDLIPRALSIMRALKSRQWIRLSKKLLAFCGMKNKKDEEILKEDFQPAVCDFDQAEWESVDNFKLKSRLLRASVEEAEKIGIDLTRRPAVKKGKFLPSQDVDDLKNILFQVAQGIDIGFDPITGERLEAGSKPPSWVQLE